MINIQPNKIYIADNRTKGNSVVIWGEVSETEFQILEDEILILKNFRECYSVKEMLLECSSDILEYFQKLRSCFIPQDDSIVIPCLITTNKLVMNYLSFLKTFLDVVSKNISIVCDGELKEFQEYDRNLYDEFFGYRFLKRMRNYAVHRTMPLQHIESYVEHGTKITCKKADLLQFDGWSSVKAEIEKLPDNISISPYIEESNIAIHKLYEKALSVMASGVIPLKNHLTEMCEGKTISNPVIVKTGSTLHQVTVESLPLYYIELFFSEYEYCSIEKMTSTN